MKTPARIAIPIALAFVIGCSNERSAGNSFETESDVAARVIQVDTILPAWNTPLDSTTVATLRFHAGNFDFGKPRPDGRDLRVLRIDSSPVSFELEAWDSKAKIGRLRVRLDSRLLRPKAQIVVKWGDSTTKGGADSTATWKGIPAAQQLLLNSVLVDDFESGVEMSLLPTWPLWQTDSSDSGKILSVTHDSAGMLRPGKVARIRYQAKGEWFVVFKVPLVRESITPRSLRSLDSIVLWTRGKGRFFVAFDHQSDGKAPKAWKAMDLDSTGWSRLRIGPQDFDSANGTGGNVGWPKVRDSVTHLTFLAGAGGEFFLDDIRLHGVDRDDLR